MRVKTIGFVGRKGGTGKSTLAAMTALEMAQAGLRVVAIDLDSQGHLGRNLGFPAGGAVAGWSMGYANIDAVAQHRENLRVLVGDASTAGAEAALWAMRKPVTHLRDLIASQVDADVVILDTAAHGYMGSEMACAAADLAVVPTPCQIGDVQTLRLLMTEFAQRREQARLPELPVLVVPNRFDTGSNRQHASERALAMIENIVSEAQAQSYDWVTLPVIQETSAINGAVLAGRPLTAHRPNHVVAAQMRATVRLIAGRVGFGEYFDVGTDLEGQIAQVMERL